MAKPAVPPDDPSSDIEELETLERPPSSPAPRSGGQNRGPLLEVGQRFGPYRLGRLLGRGAFGQVWEAQSEETGRRLALKVLSVAEPSPEMLQRFDREGRLAASLNHPHCVYVLAADQIEGAPTIAMELMPGGTLQDLLKEKGPLPPARAVDYALDILEGLEAAHAAGILHRDLKPSNCFLDEHGRAKIGDFGLSKTLELDVQLTVEGSFMGTPAYASPEQVRGAGVDARSDLYSLGATLYALLCAKSPFDGKDLGGVMARILTEEPKPLAAHGVSVPKGLQAVVRRLLEKDPARRFREHAALRAALVPFSSRGLTVVELPRRFLAFAIDLVVLAILESPLVFLFFAGGTRLASVVALSWSMKFLYFFASETWWGRTLGKALLGLRVTSDDGTPALAARQVAVRSAVFLALYEMDSLLHLVSGGEALAWPWQVALGILSALHTFIPLVTMRAANGFAGLHELVSRTRVRVVREREAVRVPHSQAARPLPEGRVPRTFGPYREEGVLWEREGEGLLLARDAALQRPVWIHHFAEAARARPLTELASHAPGRVRWLQGARNGAGWDAYEAPEGTSLVEWVRARGSLRWREMREVLMGLARALAGGAGGRGLALDRVWVDAAPGHARIADFPVVAEAPVEAAERMPAEGWRRFLHQATLFGLEGRAPVESALREGPPRAAFPEHARVLLLRICRAEPALASAESLAQELELLRRRPAQVTRRQRFFTLAVPAATPLVFLGMALVASALFKLMPTWMELLQVEDRIDHLRTLERQSGPQAQAQREAIRRVLADSYRQIRNDGRLAEALRMMPPEVHRRLEEADRDYPSLTPEQVASARRTAGLGDVRFHAGSGLRISVTGEPGGEDSLASTVRDLLAMWMGIGLLALCVSPFFGGPVLLYLAGVTVQRRDGARSDGPRRALRSLVAWSPLIAHLPRLYSPLGAVDLALFGLALFGAVYAVARPERGLPDLIAGTRLVPR